MTLSNLGRAMARLVATAWETGVDLLTLVNSLAKLVTAVPAGVLSNLMQLHAGLKLVRPAASDLVAVTAGQALARVAAFFQPMRVAASRRTTSKQRWPRSPKAWTRRWRGLSGRRQPVGSSVLRLRVLRALADGGG
ncbi:hypothetical protein ACIBAH_24765 [Streptomyces sp. NPDC051445]|uniref:hypothetical protein n=1 Tax=Streptomyces sp. NPDC051445 TaxID=3365653 RepID=UPI00378ADF83